MRKGVKEEKEEKEEPNNITHMKYRMVWLYSIFGFGLYNCYTNSLYQPIDDNLYSLTSINCYLFLMSIVPTRFLQFIKMIFCYHIS
jgi:hypothetical protein